MSKGANILVAAAAGAVLAALIANYLSTERGKQLLATATDSLKDLTSRATDYAKSNLGDIVRETRDSIGGVVKEKIAAKVNP